LSHPARHERLRYLQNPWGCAWQKFTATVAWNGLSPGVHHYWLNVEGDAYTADNVATGYVLINPRQVFLPVVLRNR